MSFEEPKAQIQEVSKEVPKTHALVIDKIVEAQQVQTGEDPRRAEGAAPGGLQGSSKHFCAGGQEGRRGAAGPDGGEELRISEGGAPGFHQ